MSAADEYGSSYARTQSGWVGWIIFAAIMMVMIGALNAIQGLAALFRDEAYWVTLNGAVLTFDITTWGWIHLLLGILLIIVGVMLMQGSTFARVVGIGLVALNLIAQFSWTTLYPFWALIVIAIDVLVIYALVVHGQRNWPDRARLSRGWASRAVASSSRWARAISAERPSRRATVSEVTVTIAKPCSRRRAVSEPVAWIPATMPWRRHPATIVASASRNDSSIVVVPGRQPEAERQVCRTDVDGIDPGHGEDVVEVAERFARLDHRDHGDDVVRRGGVVARPCTGHRRSEASGAERRVPRGTDGSHRLFGGVHHRHDDGFGTGVEDLADDTGFVPRHPGDRCRAGDQDRLEQTDGVGVVQRTVLQVGAHVVEAGACGRLCGDDRGDRQPRPKGPRPAGPALPQCRHDVLLAGSHCSGTSDPRSPASTARALSMAWR